MVFSPERILDDARADPNYLGNDDVASRSTWMPAPDGQSEILVPASAANTPADDVEPTVLKMLVQLSGDRFYLTPDGHFNPQNPMPWQVLYYLTGYILSTSNMVVYLRWDARRLRIFSAAVGQLSSDQFLMHTRYCTTNGPGTSRTSTRSCKQFSRASQRVVSALRTVPGSS